MDSEELRELQEERAQLKSLLDSDGWKRFAQSVEANFHDTFENSLAQRPTGMDDMVSKMYDMGQVSAFRRMVNWPMLRFEVLNQEIKQLTDKMENENDG